MGIKLADTLEPMGNFPAVESNNVNIDIDGTSKSIQQAYEDGDLSGDGSSIQVDTMPIASEYPNKIVQFVGESGSYQTGFFYQSISDEQNPPTYSWVQKNVQPSNATATDVSYDNTTSELIATNVQDAIDEIKGGLGTASGKNFTDLVRPNSHELVESGSVYSAINNALSSIYTPRGELTCAELTSNLLIEDNVGNIYTMSDSGTTSALFINGAGQTINVNDNVGIIKAGANTYLFNLMGDAFDLHDYQKKELSTTIASATTVEGALSALNNGKVTKYNYTMAGTASLEDDIKTFVTALIALGANTYVGFFNRSGSLGTAGNYSITIYAEEGTSTFASGYIALGAGALGKTQYIVSYYKPTGSSEEWTIKKLATTDEIVTKFDVTIDATSNPIDDIKTIVNQLVSMSTKTTTYCGSIYRATSGANQGCFGNYDISVYIVDSGAYTGNTHVNGTLTFGMGGNSNVENTYFVSCSIDVVSGGTIYWNIQPLAIEEGNIRYKVLPTNTDLNTITDEGIYSLYVENASNSHAPRIGWLQLIVIRMNNDNKFQNQILYTNTECFRRYNDNNAWSEWEQDVFQHNIIVNSPSELLANGYDSIVYTLNHADWSFLTSHGNVTASGHFQLGGYWFGMYTANHIGSNCIVVNGVACWNTLPIRFSAYHDPTTLAWTVRCDETVTVNTQLSTDSNGNLPIYSLLPTNDVEIISLRGTDVSSNYTYIPSRDSSGNWWCQMFFWDGTKLGGSVQPNIELRYRRL